MMLDAQCPHCGHKVTVLLVDEAIAATAPAFENMSNPKSPEQPQALEAGWHPIGTLDRSQMQFVLVLQDFAVRLWLWNPSGHWETGVIRAGVWQRVQELDECSNPTHWRELPSVSDGGSSSASGVPLPESVGLTAQVRTLGKRAAEEIREKLQGRQPLAYCPDPHCPGCNQFTDSVASIIDRLREEESKPASQDRLEEIAAKYANAWLITGATIRLEQSDSDNFAEIYTKAMRTSYLSALQEARSLPEEGK